MPDPYIPAPVPCPRARALKEWAAVIDALEQGTQILTLRKGGIREKSFLLAERSFFLLPTFEHQAAALMKPAYQAGLSGVGAAQRDEQGLIVRVRAEATDVWEIDDGERLAALEPFHMFTADYARARFSWRPKQPLTVLLLRVYRLAAPWQTGLPPGAGGCRSWFDLDAAAAPADAAPVLSDAAFEARAAQLRQALTSPCHPLRA